MWLDQSDPRSYGDAENWYDMSGQGNHGSQATASYQPGIVSGSGFSGYARSFDGSDDYVDCGGASFFDFDEVTIIVWIYLIDNPLTNTESIIEKRESVSPYKGWHFYESGALLGFQWNDTSTHNYQSGNIGILAKTWYQVAVTAVKGGIGYFYKDGQRAGSSFDTSGIGSTINSENLKIAGHVGSYYLHGLLDDVRIFNRALSAAEIKKLYLADKPRYGGL